MRTIFVSVLALLACTIQAYAREWKDATGGFSVEADLEEASGNTVTLKKENGVLLRIPLQKLSKDDQDFVRQWMASSGVRNLMAAAVKVFQAAEGAETTSQGALLEKEAAKKFCERFRGTNIMLRFPISDVRPYRDRHQIAVHAPDIPFTAPAHLRFCNEFYFRLTKEDVLAITPDSVLIVTGKARLRYDGSLFGGDFANEAMAFQSATTENWIVLSLDGIGFKIVNQKREKPARSG
ncbi:MAG: SHD1 domain-containing protein [Pirellulales bacterium]